MQVSRVQVSVVVPAFRAQGTIARAIKSVIAQTIQDWEAIVVSDDESDYAAQLRVAGIADGRLRFVSTGGVGSGCHVARNCGLAVVRGDYVVHLDADDLLRPHHFEALLPIAGRDGAAVGDCAVIAEATEQELYRPFAGQRDMLRLDITALLDLSVPLFPMTQRQFAEPRLPGIELAEDVVANLRLIDRIGVLPALGETLWEYRVTAGSLSHGDTSARGFEDSYTALIERLENGDRLGLSAGNAKRARDGFVRKRDFNRAFAVAREREPGLDFQTFAARARRG